MATPTASRDIGSGDGSIIQFSYTLTTADPSGSPIEFTDFADVTVVARGTWGGATLKVQGSDDGSTFVATPGLSNAAGGAEFTASADKIATLIERPRFIRPILTTVGAGASITVVLTLRRSSSLRT